MDILLDILMISLMVIVVGPFAILLLGCFVTMWYLLVMFLVDTVKDLFGG